MERAIGVTENRTLDGKAVIVTGATAEPGRTIVAALAGAGANVAAIDDEQEPLQALAVEVAGGGAPGRVLAMAADLGQPDMGRRAVSRASLAFGEIGGLVIRAAGGEATAAERRRDGSPPFWDADTAGAEAGSAPDVLLSLAAPAARQFRARGWGRLIVAAGDDATAAFRLRIADWARDLEGAGVTVTLLIANAAPPDALAAAVRWLMSEDADGFNGQLLSAADWDPALPAPEAARKAARPIG